MAEVPVKLVGIKAEGLLVAMCGNESTRCRGGATHRNPQAHAPFLTFFSLFYYTQILTKFFSPALTRLREVQLGFARAREVCAAGAMSGGNGEGPTKRRQSVGAAIARLAGETSDNMKKPNDGGRLCSLRCLARRVGRAMRPT